jgi:hypothetical protein
MATTTNGSQQKPTIGGQPCLTLAPAVKSDVDETELVQFTLKVRAGSSTNAPTYKRKVARFNSGTPAEWIAVLEALEEIFAQNSVVTALDRENVIRTILRGDSWTAFESSIQESRVNVENLTEPLALTVEMVNIALKAVTTDVFPHRALLNQLNWMKRRMRKPATMSIRQFVASVTQMNGHLVHFPGATNEELFSPPKLLELLEFSLPDSWRAKFDLAGYIPTNHDKTRLILEGEQIERAAALAKTAAIKPKQHSTAAGKTGFKKNKARKGNSKGPVSASSPAAKHKPPAKGDSAVGKTFSGNKFRKELYALSKNKDRVKVIDQYAAVLEAERKKAVRRNTAVKKAKKSKETDTSSSEGSDDDVSVHVMNAEEVRNERTEFVKNRLRATMKRLVKRRVKYSTTGTNAGTMDTDAVTMGTETDGTMGTDTMGTEGTMDTDTGPMNPDTGAMDTIGTIDTTNTGTNDQIEEEVAFNEQVNRSDN